MCLCVAEGEMKEAVDWKSLAFQLGSLQADGSEAGGSRYARQALELLLGEVSCRQAVDYYFSGEAGHGLACNMLSLARPWSARQYCYELSRSGEGLETRRLAVELLRAVADERALCWVDEFLEDDGAEIQAWGAGVLEQLCYWGLVDVGDAEALIEKMEMHVNEGVREQARLIRELVR